MPRVESVFRVNLPVKAVWSFMSDRNEVGCLFPGCKGVKILDHLDELNREGATIIMITHERDVAERARRRITLVDGRLQGAA